jgi:hypothetical protein
MVYTGRREIKLKWKELDLVCKGLEVLIAQERTLESHGDPIVWEQAQESIAKLEDLADFLYFVLYDRPIQFNSHLDSTGNQGDGVQ